MCLEGEVGSGALFSYVQPKHLGSHMFIAVISLSETKSTPPKKKTEQLLLRDDCGATNANHI